MSLSKRKACQDERYYQLKRRVEQLEKSYKTNPLIQPYRPHLSKQAPIPAWSKFFRLKDAIAKAHYEASEDIGVFAIEPKGDLVSAGKREFIVASYEEFWFYYVQFKDGERHFYEVIQEGAVCHLYFDLEFSKSYNPGLNGDDLIERFLLYVFQKVQGNFDVTISREHVLDLDSTNESKFSRHLIIHLPNTVFRSNRDVGEFVTQICDESGQEFMVQTSDKPTYFVDTGVYTRNRNFRLFLSSKKGKSSILKRHDDCKFHLTHQDTRSACCIHHAQKNQIKSSKLSKPTYKDVDEMIFYASLITNVKYHENLQIITCGVTENTRTKTDGKFFSYDQSWTNYSASPFPVLQDFVLSIAKAKIVDSYVSKWLYFPSNRIVIYNIAGNRFCGNIGRQHKSNRIYYVADLVEKCCYQKCYDPVCKAIGYRSPSIRIPNDIIDSLFDDIDDIDLVNVVEEIENGGGMQDGYVWGDVSDDTLLVAASDAVNDQ